MFKEIAKHLSKLKINLTIQEGAEPGTIIVSCIPTIKNGEKAVNAAIPPFTVKGTPEELDEKFCEAFEQAAGFLTESSTKMDDWKKKADEATQKSEGAKKLKEVEEKKIKDAKEKAKKTIEKADEQFKLKKYDAAKLYYREALTAVGGKDSALEKKIAECDKLFGAGGGLFGTPVSEETTTTTDENDIDTESGENEEDDNSTETD